MMGSGSGWSLMRIVGEEIAMEAIRFGRINI